jgi:hypothetical protein
MSDEYHALASPSSSAKWLNCANSLAMEIGQPEGDAKAADLGTDKHELLALCLEFQKNAMDYAGHVLKKGHTVNGEVAADVQTVLDSVRERIRAYELRGATVTVDVEQDVPIDHITGESDATGRVDIVLRISWPDGSTDADVIDAKFGYQEVLAENNTQGLMYMSGVIEKFSLVDEFRNITFVIEQPLRTNSEWQVTPAIVNEWVEWASPRAAKAILIHKMAGERALKEEDFAPAEKTCQWCKAKAICPALRAKVEDTIGASFEAIDKGEDKPWDANTMESLTLLGSIFPHLELIEDWIKAVRARIELEVFAGRNVPGVKVVAGKRGNRQWSSDDEAEALMKKFKMKQEQMYSFKLLGPKPILEALKDQPRRLKQIEALVVQAEGKPHVVLDSDKRPAIEIKPVEDGFDTVDELC